MAGKGFTTEVTEFYREERLVFLCAVCTCIPKLFCGGQGSLVWNFESGILHAANELTSEDGYGGKNREETQRVRPRRGSALGGLFALHPLRPLFERLPDLS